MGKRRDIIKGERTARIRYSAAAEADLAAIGDYTFRTWGEAQTSRYLRALEDCCERLVGNAMLGRACDWIRPGLRRMEEGRHVIFYRLRDSGIFVSRILHQSMSPDRHSFEDVTPDV